MIFVKFGDEGKLFGFVGICDIVDVLIVVGVEIVKVEVFMFNGVICNIGDFEFDIQVYSDVIVIIKVFVVFE